MLYLLLLHSIRSGTGWYTGAPPILAIVPYVGIAELQLVPRAEVNLLSWT